MESVSLGYLEYVIIGLLSALLLNTSRLLYSWNRVQRVRDGPQRRPSNNLKPDPDDLLARLSHNIRPLPRQCFTLGQLSKYNGQIHEENLEKLIYVAVSGIVYNVSSSRALYGVDGLYACFAGRDITVALAKGNRGVADVKLEDTALSETEMTNLWKWEQKFINKYEVIGFLDGPSAG
ncbi:cytochrome b5-like heme/steroid binding domain-containing protein [Ilyonectria sp. MPI-CAGE-AT-0026]|nr:cytochrome b5-like heme/steroid binding domain-containing protein [Ilyonectria sp. MPI-CAGE-AT-0026]